MRFDQHINNLDMVLENSNIAFEAGASNDIACDEFEFTYGGKVFTKAVSTGMGLSPQNTEDLQAVPVGFAGLWSIYALADPSLVDVIFTYQQAENLARCSTITGVLDRDGPALILPRLVPTAIPVVFIGYAVVRNLTSGSFNFGADFWNDAGRIYEIFPCVCEPTVNVA